jgi:hypothetical protein
VFFDAAHFVLLAGFVNPSVPGPLNNLVPGL